MRVHHWHHHSKNRWCRSNKFIQATTPFLWQQRSKSSLSTSLLGSLSITPSLLTKCHLNFAQNINNAVVQLYLLNTMPTLIGTECRGNQLNSLTCQFYYCPSKVFQVAPLLTNVRSNNVLELAGEVPGTQASTSKEPARISEWQALSSQEVPGPRSKL